MKADLPAIHTPHAARAESGELPKKKITLSYFFGSIPFAFGRGIIPVPNIECAASVGFDSVVLPLWLVACGYAFHGWRTQRRGYVIAATLLLWFAPDLYWFILVQINRVSSPPPFHLIPDGWWGA
jgi:hypothetical protein